MVWRGGLSRCTAPLGPEVDLERRAGEGESPVGPGNRERRDEGPHSSSRVVWECSPNRVVDSIQGWKTGARPIEDKYREGKVKSTLKREFKRA